MPRLLDAKAPLQAINQLARHKSMAMTKRYDHANEERYGGAIEALDDHGQDGQCGGISGGEVVANLASLDLWNN